jgi:hypothetical protein
MKNASDDWGKGRLSALLLVLGVCALADIPLIPLSGITSRLVKKSAPKLRRSMPTFLVIRHSANPCKAVEKLARFRVYAWFLRRAALLAAPGLLVLLIGDSGAGLGVSVGLVYLGAALGVIYAMLFRPLRFGPKQVLVDRKVDVLRDAVDCVRPLAGELRRVWENGRRHRADDGRLVMAVPDQFESYCARICDALKRVAVL